MKMKHIVGILLAIMLLGSTAQAEEFTVDKNGFTQGTMDYRGHTIIIAALIDDNFPSPLIEVQLAGGGLSEKQIVDAAKQCFQIAPKKQRMMYHSTFVFGNGEDCVSSNQIPFQSVHPVTDGVLQERLRACYAFCDALGISYPQAPIQAVYFIKKTPGGVWEITPQAAQKTPDAYIGIRIPIAIEGIPIDYARVGSYGYVKTPTEEASIDYPYVSIAFDADGRLVSANVSNYSVASTRPLEGTPIPWKDAIKVALDVALDRYMEKPKTVEEFFSEFDIHINRVQAVWFPNWVAQLRPGYYVSFDVYDKATGEFVSPMSDRFRMNLDYGVEAIAGTPSDDYMKSAQ